jgi:hypothetical protein
MVSDKYGEGGRYFVRTGAEEMRFTKNRTRPISLYINIVNKSFENVTK